MKALAVLAAFGLALTGCATLPPAAAGGWTVQTSATAGAAMTLGAAGGRDALRIACRRDPGDLYVASDLAGAAAGPVTLRIGERAFALEPGRGEPRLSATAALPDGLPAALMSGGRIALSHPGGQVGPYAGPDPQTAAAFAIACRR